MQFLHFQYCYDYYGGCIFAVGIVSGTTYYDAPAEEYDYHWKSRTYAPISDVTFLDYPVRREQFIDFIQPARQATITPVYGDEFKKLMSIILKQNDLPDSFRNKIAAPEGLKDIDAKDWLTLGKKLGFRY